MPPTSPHLPRRLLAVFLLIACLAGSAIASDDAGQWVRVHHRSDLPTLQSAELQERLADYGNFQWGRLTRLQVERLRARGLSVTAEKNPFELTLGGQRFDPLTDFPTSGLRTTSSTPAGQDFRLVQFSGPIRRQWLNSVSQHGVRLIQYIHPYTYIVWADPEQLATLDREASVRWYGEFLPEFRLNRAPEQLAASNDEKLPTAIVFGREMEFAEIERSIRRSGGELIKASAYTRDLGIAAVSVPESRYPELASSTGIYSVQRLISVSPRDEMSNQTIVNDFASNQDVVPGYNSWLSDVGYYGSGVTVSIIDGGIRSSHVDLVDNMGTCVSGGSPTSCTTANNSHGTHVAGAVAGSAVSGNTDSDGFLQGQGVAPSATLIQQRYSSPGLTYNWGSTCDNPDGPYCLSPDGILVLFKEAFLSGASLANNSWGSTGFGNGYDLPTQQLDVVTRDANPDMAGNQPVLPVWAVQNGGGDGAGCGQASMGSPEEAKNAFAVGASQLRPGTTSSGTVPDPSNTYGIGPNSAHGPACDGRLVPHIVAPGCFTQSTSSGTDTHYTNACGTSMATPVTSGAVAIFFEYFRDLFSIDPSPALTKAAFAAAAIDGAGNPNADGVTMGHRPDRFQGFGRLDLDAVVNPANSVLYFDQEEIFASTGETWSQALVADDPSEPVRIVLAWTDAHGAGLGGTTPAWVNNLDLSVSAGGTDFAGNAIASDGWSEPGGSFDAKNNLEGVFLSSSQHKGAFDITVIAANIAADALNPTAPGAPQQDFALACYNCIIGDPTYTIGATPETLEACIPESGSTDYDVDVTLGALGSYSGTVNLSSSGEPAGVSSGVAPASVAVPGAAVWTLTVADSATPGESLLTIDGDDGSDQHSAELSLVMDEYLGSAPSQAAPADGATDLVLSPTFEWSALPDIGEYRIQIATDAGFGAPVVDQAVSASSFTPASDLALDTEYFWRVQGVNLCGGGDWSAVRSFTTRLEPEASLSQASFAFELNAGATDTATLSIGNTGTGNLTWEIATDQLPAAVRGAYDPARDEVLALDDFNLPGSGNSSTSVEGGVSTDGSVIGFSFEGTVSGITGTNTYASDMAMTVTAPDGPSYTVGGFQTGNPEWDFQGGGSDDDGTYASTHLGAGIFGSEGTADDGTWQFDFEHTYNDAMDWTSVTVTLHKLPPPFCEAPLSTPGWLGVSPTSGSVGAGLSEDVTLSIDASGMPEGDHVGYLCVTTNDPANPLVAIEVQLGVTAGIFADRFQGAAP